MKPHRTRPQRPALHGAGADARGAGGKNLGALETSYPLRKSVRISRLRGVFSANGIPKGGLNAHPRYARIYGSAGGDAMLRRSANVILNITFIGILSATVSSLAVAAEMDESANYWLPFCRQVAKGNFYQGDAFRNGGCAGIITGLLVLGRSAGVFCRPDGVTVEQAVRVVVQFLDQHPARTNENFNALAIEAMRDAWPCSH
jgi:hypothetical protein